jgi:cytochrome oxidase Cu insertion factor (SCO1/SenC/PrrC family)
LATWHILTSNLTALNAVWRAYGVSVNVSRASGIVAHNDVMYFVDPSGRLRYEATPFANENSAGAFSLPSASIDRWGQGIATYARQLLGESP